MRLWSSRGSKFEFCLISMVVFVFVVVVTVVVAVAVAVAVVVVVVVVVVEVVVVFVLVEPENSCFASSANLLLESKKSVISAIILANGCNVLHILPFFSRSKESYVNYRV